LSYGTAIDILVKLHIVIHSHHNFQTYHIILYDTAFQFINKYRPINMMHAITIANALKEHMETILPDKRVLTGGHWNFTLAVQDRKNRTEKHSPCSTN
jgi:hypothetical protein